IGCAPDSPSVDEPSGGTLRFSGHWILTNICVTQSDILVSALSNPARQVCLAVKLPSAFALEG
ncbi:cell wall-associated hydrolase, partial [Trifolium medium]|nr:cell wall-associated hydrolase [Trifolium medium]